MGHIFFWKNNGSANSIALLCNPGQSRHEGVFGQDWGVEVGGQDHFCCRLLVFSVNPPGGWPFKLEVPLSCCPPSPKLPCVPLCWHRSSGHQWIR